jgi:hypothetical protein
MHHGSWAEHVERVRVVGCAHGLPSRVNEAATRAPLTGLRSDRGERIVSGVHADLVTTTQTWTMMTMTIEEKVGEEEEGGGSGG